jgi:hypothetical protein
MQKYFVVKYDRNNFPSRTIVKFIANTYHGCNLVENIDNKERIWLMTYDLYPIIDHDNFLDWSYNKDFQSLIPSEYYIVKNNNKNEKVVKLLNNTNEVNCVVLDLESNQKIILDKNILIKANQL